ncbi:MAG: chromosome segregation protein SMC, partial [Clostridia bacterium]|nr:chromosome segregation protein SMC [Clostridia bacterium]
EMYLKSIELHGFKSFPNRTVMTFDRGATVIVGPNGSGKSNISDAMRWVLGELSSRNIRGTKMEDVIFGGASSKRPMNFAEVSVTFDNSDPNHRIDSPYEEITVTRRYYRGGDSEYMINRQKCRLRDIFELFMNTGVGREGYSIIGQGKIAEIISKKSEDRRNFFEEAAGISKFRHRKHEAENKLTATEANMLREQDILSELEARVVPLEKEAEKAKKYLVVAEEKRQADVSLWLYDTQKLRDDIFKYTEQSTLAQNKLDILTEALDSLRRQVTDLEQANVAGRLRSEELLGSITALTDRMHALDNRYGLSESEISHLKSLIDQCKERIGDIEGEKTQACEEIARIEAAIKEIEKNQNDVAAQKEATLNEQKRLAEQVVAYDKALADGQEEIDRLEAALTDERVRFDVLRTTSEEGGNRFSAISEEIKGYEQTAKALEAEAARCDKAASVYRDKISSVEETMQEASEKDQTLSMQREQLFARINSLSVTRDTLLEKAQTLKHMEEQLDGYGGGVRFIVDKAKGGALKGTVYGPVSKLIHIENKYVTAIETALGASIQHIIVDTDDTAKEAIELLKAARAGRCTFLPVSTIRPSGESEEMRQAAKCKGYVDRADRLTDTDARFRPIVEWMLMRTAVFDTLENAVSAARTLRHKVRIVTLDGQIMNVGGSMTGGANASEGRGILSRGAQIDGILAEAKKKEDELSVLEKERKALDDEILEARQTIRDCEQNKELLQTMSRAQFAALDQANAKLEANRNLLDKLLSDKKELESTRSQSEAELETVSQKIETLETLISDKKAERAQLSVTRNGVDDSKA